MVVVVLVCNMSVLTGDSSQWGKRLCWAHERGAMRWKVLDPGVTGPMF